MFVIGVDVSSRAIDYVTLPLDNDRATWTRVEAHGRLGEDRLASLRGRLPAGTWWDDVCLVALEWPAGAHRRSDTLLGAFLGLVVGAIPVRLAPWYLRPAEWRKACGMAGNASKDQVSEFVLAKTPSEPFAFTGGYEPEIVAFNALVKAAHSWERVAPSMWPQDACDAYCVAWAARAINERSQADPAPAKPWQPVYMERGDR